MIGQGGGRGVVGRGVTSSSGSSSSQRVGMDHSYMTVRRMSYQQPYVRKPIRHPPPHQEKTGHPFYMKVACKYPDHYYYYYYYNNVADLVL